MTQVKEMPGSTSSMCSGPEFTAAGGSFERDGLTFDAVTSHTYGGVTWDPKSLKTSRVGDSFVVDDYTDPVIDIAIRTTYRKRSARATLAGVRAANSGYGKGRTLQDHEASHAADTIDYLRTKGPRLGDGRGTEAASFNTSLRTYFDAATNLSANIGTYSKASTDCPGTRNAAPAREADLMAPRPDVPRASHT